MKYFLIFVVFSLLTFPVFFFPAAGNSGSVPDINSVLDIQIQNKQLLEKTFANIENGLSAGNVNLLSSHLSSQTYLSLLNGVRGYYSQSQTYYILQDLFKVNKSVTFRYTSVVINKNPYATGVLTYELRNKKETAQVFLSLEYSGNKWTISQLTIR